MRHRLTRRLNNLPLYGFYACAHTTASGSLRYVVGRTR